jgi:hypothetical protein
MQTVAILVAGRTALEVCPHARDRGIGIGAVEFELDVAVQLLKALLAAELRPPGTGESRE